MNGSPFPLSTSSISHSRYHSDLSLLSPGPPRSFTWVMDTSIDEGGLSAIPPALTLSIQPSVHFTTSTALRDNEAADRSAPSARICPTDPSRSRCRRSSTAIMTSADDGTVIDHSPAISHLCSATSDATFSTRSVVEALNSLTPTHVGSISDISKSEKWVQDHREPGRKVRGGAQGTTEAEGDNGGVVEARNEPSLFYKLRGGRFGSSSFYLRSGESGVSRGDRIAL